MGCILFDEILPVELRHPDECVPISPLGLPQKAKVMRAGFEPHQPGEVLYEGETEVDVRLCERIWRYRLASDPVGKVRTESAWRLEFSVQSGGKHPFKRGCEIVLAQYELSEWVARFPFRRYTKKKVSERVHLLDEAAPSGSAIKWLEQHVTIDSWETNKKLVAGISQPGWSEQHADYADSTAEEYLVAGLSEPRGFYCDSPRNTAGDLIVGSCPNLDAICKEIHESAPVQALLADTVAGRIRCACLNKEKVQVFVPLFPQTIDERFTLMGLAIMQAVAGPWSNVETWIGQPVSKMVDRLYRNHLNRYNRAEMTRRDNRGVELTDTTGVGRRNAPTAVPKTE